MEAMNRLPIFRFLILALSTLLIGCQSVKPVDNSDVVSECKIQLPSPTQTAPVSFDSSLYKERMVFDLPDYAAFGFGDLYKYTTDGWPSPEIKNVADFNGDGRDDLILDYFETLVPPIVLMSKVDGTFESAKVDPSAARRHIRNAEVADFNNDGLIDFAGFTTGEPPRLWEGQGHDTKERFTSEGEPDVLLINKGAEFINVLIPEQRKNDWNHGGSAGDIDNDGLVDILPLSEWRKLKKAPLKNQGGEVFVLSPIEYSHAVSNSLTSDMDTGDFNGDGFLDIAVAITSESYQSRKIINIPSIRIIYGDGDFDFSNNKEISAGKTWLTYDDIQEWKASAKRPVVGGKPAGIKGKFFSGAGNIESIDLNSDGMDDILVGHWLSTTGLWKTAGFKAYLSGGDCFVDATDQLFPNQKTNRILEEKYAVAYVQNFRFADINNDGLNDLVLQSDNVEDQWFRREAYAGHPYIFINQGSYWLPVKGLDVKQWTNVDDIVPGDFNGDGLTDLAYIRRDLHTPGVKLYVSYQQVR